MFVILGVPLERLCKKTVWNEAFLLGQKKKFIVILCTEKCNLSYVLYPKCTDRPVMRKRYERNVNSPFGISSFSIYCEQNIHNCTGVYPCITQTMLSSSIDDAKWSISLLFISNKSNYRTAVARSIHRFHFNFSRIIKSCFYFCILLRVHK